MACKQLKQANKQAFVEQSGAYEVSPSLWGTWGVPSGDFPTWFERATFVWLNMARMAPTWFRDTLVCVCH
jgi:hypothetical protein